MLAFVVGFALLAGVLAQKVEHEQTDQSFLEMSSGQATLYTCTATGGGTVTSFDLNNFRPYQVVGTNEYLLVQGPTAANTQPFTVQATQIVSPDCGRGSPDVTVFKDVAMRCGDFYAVVKPNNFTSGCVIPPDALLYPQIFLRGQDTSGGIYDGRDYYRDDKVISESKIISFTQGNIQFTATACKTGCTSTYRKTAAVSVRFQCEGTVTTVSLDMASGITTTTASVVVSDFNKILCGRSKNIASGLCGCWAAPTNPTNDWTTCNRTRFFDTTTRASAACTRPSFTTTQDTSIFALFEYWTQKYPVAQRYDSMYALIGMSQANRILGVDSVKMTQSRTSCRQFMADVFEVVPDYSKAATDPRILLADNLVTTCINDMYSDALVWTKDTAATRYCETATRYINAERQDIFCAFTRLSDQCTTVDPSTSYLTLLSTAKSTSQISQIKTQNTGVSTMITEIDSSLDNVDYWYVPSCEALIPDLANITQRDCSKYTFTDTSSLTCPNTAPEPFSEWDGVCARDQTSGGKCTIKCSAGALVFPDTAAARVEYTCSTAVVNSVPSAFWDGKSGRLQCCVNNCTRTQRRASTCAVGLYDCVDCATGMVANTAGTSCQAVDCPTFASGSPNCACNAGYFGNLTWSRPDGRWVGTCQVANCPANAGTTTTACRCSAGYAGTLTYSSVTGWSGTCTICTAGATFASAAGATACSACRACNSVTETLRTECTISTDRVCQCQIGHFSSGGVCTACVQTATIPGISKYSDVPGLTACKDCMVCNSLTEVVSAPCTTTANTKCKCNIYSTSTNVNGCYELI